MFDFNEIFSELVNESRITQEELDTSVRIGRKNGHQNLKDVICEFVKSENAIDRLFNVNSDIRYKVHSEWENVYQTLANAAEGPFYTRPEHAIFNMLYEKCGFDESEATKNPSRDLKGLSTFLSNYNLAASKSTKYLPNFINRLRLVIDHAKTKHAALLEGLESEPDVSWIELFASKLGEKSLFETEMEEYSKPSSPPECEGSKIQKPGDTSLTKQSESQHVCGTYYCFRCSHKNQNNISVSVLKISEDENEGLTYINRRMESKARVVTARGGVFKVPARGVQTIGVVEANASLTRKYGRFLEANFMHFHFPWDDEGRSTSIYNGIYLGMKYDDWQSHAKTPFAARTFWVREPAWLDKDEASFLRTAMQMSCDRSIFKNSSDLSTPEDSELARKSQILQRFSQNVLNTIQHPREHDRVFELEDIITRIENDTDREGILTDWSLNYGK